MQSKEKVSDAQLRGASVLVSRYIGLEVVDAVVHGSVLRGFNDPHSDIDVCFLLNRPISDYLNISSSPFFENHLEERKRRTMQLSSTISRELGWKIMVSLLDMRSLLRGIMHSSMFSLMAYEALAEKNDYVKFLFDPVYKEYLHTSNLVYRCGEQIQHGIQTHNALGNHKTEYKQERTFLGTLWSTHRLLAYIGGDLQHVRTIDELIEFNRERWCDTYPEGFDSVTIDVIRARTNRSPFEAPKGVSETASHCLNLFVKRTLLEAGKYLREHPQRYPSTAESACEMVDLYRCIIDREKNIETTKQPLQNNEQALLAA